MVNDESTTEGVLSGSGDPHQTHDIPNAAPASDPIEVLEGSTRSIGRYLPKAGDRCVVDGSLVEITTFDTAANLFTAEMQVGRSINRITGHISNTRFEPLSDGAHVISTDGLELAQSETSTIASPTQETVDEGLSRVTASQGNEFTSYSQAHLLAQQPQAGDPQELAIRKLAGEVDLSETPSDRDSVDANAPAEATDSASVSQHESE